MRIKILGSASKTFDAVKYHYTKMDAETGELISIKNFPEGISASSAPSEMKAHLKEVSKRSRSKKPQFHAVISCRFQLLSKEDFKALAEKFMENMGYDKQPYAVIYHMDTQHSHAHIVSTRIDVEKGTKIRDFYEFLVAGTAFNSALESHFKFSFEDRVRNLLEYEVESAEEMRELLTREGYQVCRNLKLGGFNVRRNKGHILHYDDSSLRIAMEFDLRRLDQIEWIVPLYQSLFQCKLFAVKQEYYRRNHGGGKIRNERFALSFESEVSHKLKELQGIDLRFQKDNETGLLQLKITDHRNKIVFPSHVSYDFLKSFELSDYEILKNDFLALNEYEVKGQEEKEILMDVYRDTGVKDFMIFQKERPRKSPYRQTIKKDVEAYIGNHSLPLIEIVKSKDSEKYYALHKRYHHIEELSSLVSEKAYTRYLNQISAVQHYQAVAAMKEAEITKETKPEETESQKPTNPESSEQALHKYLNDLLNASKKRQLAGEQSTHVSSKRVR